MRCSISLALLSVSTVNPMLAEHAASGHEKQAVLSYLEHGQHANGMALTAFVGPAIHSYSVEPRAHRMYGSERWPPFF